VHILYFWHEPASHLLYPRFHSILYNADAVQAEEIRNKDESDGGSSPNVIFLQPMKYDEEVNLI